MNVYHIYESKRKIGFTPTAQEADDICKYNHHLFWKCGKLSDGDTQLIRNGENYHKYTDIFFNSTTFNILTSKILNN